MAYSRSLQLVFVHVPKCAGTSIIEAMRAIDSRVDHGHVPWSHYARAGVMNGEALSFAVCRNPWDRALSSYRYSTQKLSYWHGPQARLGLHSEYKLLRKRTFAETVRMLHGFRDLLDTDVEQRPFFKTSWDHQHPYVCDAAGAIVVDRLFRFEQLDEMSTWLRTDYGLQVGHLNPTDARGGAGSDYRGHYDDETAGLVAEIYATDIATFGYTFD